MLAVLAALMIFGLLGSCLALYLIFTLPSPGGLLLVVIAAVAPALIYSTLVMLLDRIEAEPWYTMVGAFFWGAIVATFFSLIANTAGGIAVLDVWGQDAYDILVPIFIAPPVEETMKGAALLVLLLAFRHEFDGMLDGIIYGALVGLGFAMTENMLYFSTFLNEMGLGGLLFGFFLRAGLGGFSHAIFTAITGAGIALARTRYGRGTSRFVVPILGLALAIVLHSFWNAVAVAGGELGAVVSFTGLGVLFFFVTLPGIVITLMIARNQWHQQWEILQHQLLPEVANGVLTMQEYEMITTPSLRRRAVWKVLKTHGPLGWLRLRQFTRLASRLAFQKYHAMQGEPRPSGIGRRSDRALRLAIGRARERLTAA